ncbi:MAG TPA: 2,3-bisphosphoglycerate-independent phosphoglycerate mutase [bacterium]|jgi:2,3-bisphosphoglycerate-independent phosphoglycerate mutase|nr:2,3-bisphosphoglycerate-independent phosphoglycerate mutase [bacterium]HOG38326.1 2,3-bisphosphoglycerate-independent phosphoglycerate mutase [bacterium]HQI03289.1 2,3-bisphosphoglycerate-independent phosphoglycerate mutase [bacterium]
MTTKPVVLIILDGWGVYRPSIGNAITLANLSYWDELINTYPSFLLQASGEAVGLPYGEMGNSEVGHLTMGSGQIVLQSLNRINRKILDGGFFENESILKAIEHVKKNKSSLHLMGLLGTGGVHSYGAHLESLIKIARDNEVENVYLHLFLDGRDTPKNKSVDFLNELIKTLDIYGCGKIATLSGRFYAMDRNNNWERIKESYDAIFHGVSKESFDDPVLAVRASYAKNIYDEEFKPVVITENNKPVAVVEDNDAIIFFNFRADRARQMTKAIVLDDFNEFERGDRVSNILMVTFTEYEVGLPVEIAFKRQDISGTLSEIVSSNGLKQLHIAETEKYAHVTFFFNGLKEEKLINEERILIQSPSVDSYDEKPEMSSLEICEKIKENLQEDNFDFYVVNFANPDMVGHTGNLKASIMAVESVSKCLSEIVPIILEKDGTALITADHGNVEEVVDLKSGEINKEHSNFPVPFLIVDNKFKGKNSGFSPEDLYKMKISGVLSDIAPTVLSFLNLKQSPQMNGINLAKLIK